MAGNFDGEIKQAMSGGNQGNDPAFNRKPAASADKSMARAQTNVPLTPAKQKPPAVPLQGGSASNSAAAVVPGQHSPGNDPIIHAAGIAHAILNRGMVQ